MIITLKINNPYLEEELFLFLEEQKQSLEEITIEALQFFINTFKKNKDNDSTAFFNTLRNRNLKNELILSPLVMQEYIFTLSKLKVDREIIEYDTAFYFNFLSIP